MSKIIDQIRGLSKRSTIIEGLSYNAKSKTATVGVDNKYLNNLKEFARRQGLDIKTDREGKYITIPGGYSRDEQNSFISDWLTSFNLPGTEVVKSYYDAYDLMDSNVSLITLALDTYADEALSVGFLDNDPLKIEISDKEIQEKVEKVLDINKYYKKQRGIVRSLAKYGDIGIELQPEGVVSEEHSIKLTTRRATLITPIVMDDSEVISSFKIKMDLKRLSRLRNFTKTRSERVVQSYDFAYYSLYDEELFPYGRSMLYNAKPIADQLTTLETLLALGRANNVNRLIIKVPAPEGDAVEAFEKVSQVKGMYKNTLFDEPNLGQKAGRKIPGVNEILWMPNTEGFDISNLKVDVNMADTADVDHFENKLKDATRLPKGFFSGDEVTSRGGALAEQDLKFSRLLLTLQDAYCEGVADLVLRIILKLGCEITDDLEIKVSLEKPIQLSADMIAQFSDKINLAKEFLSLNSEITAVPGQESPKPMVQSNAYQLLQLLGIPEQIAKLVTSVGALEVMPKAQDNFLLGQKVAISEGSKNESKNKDVKDSGYSIRVPITSYTLKCKDTAPKTLIESCRNPVKV